MDRFPLPLLIGCDLDNQQNEILVELYTFKKYSLYMNDDAVDEDTGEVIPIIRIFIKNFIVSVGSKEEYEEHEYFYDRIQQGDLLSEQCPESFISPGHC